MFRLKRVLSAPARSLSPAAKRIFITGASSGIGRALALHYSRGGARLGLTGRREDTLTALATALGENARAYCVDVRDACGMHSVAQQFLNEVGVPDIVIANAGVSHGTLTGEREDIDTFQDIFDTNVIGMVKTFHPFIAPMAQLGCGKLVGIASVAGVRGLPGAGAYSASKAAAISYLESLRIELRPVGVKVITLLPGYIDTPMTAGNPYPMPFLLTADDAARRFARIIDQGRSVAVVPWPMAIVARLLRILPTAIYDALLARAPRKPRRTAE